MTVNVPPVRYQRVRVYVPSLDTTQYENKVSRLIRDTFPLRRVEGYVPASRVDPGVLICWVRHPHCQPNVKCNTFKPIDYTPLPDELILKGETLQEYSEDNHDS